MKLCRILVDHPALPLIINLLYAQAFEEIMNVFIGRRFSDLLSSTRLTSCC